MRFRSDFLRLIVALRTTWVWFGGFVLFGTIGCVTPPKSSDTGFLRADEKGAIASARQANAFVDLGRFADAELKLRQSLKQQPDSVSLLNGLGYVLSKQGRIPAALELFYRARKLRPDYTPATINIARTLAESNDFAAALPEWERALAELKDIAATKDRRIFTERALAAEIQRAYQGLATVQTALGSMDEALCYSELALKNQWNIQTVAAHTRLLLEAGKYRESAALLEQLFGKMQVEDVPTTVALDYAVSLYESKQIKKCSSMLSSIRRAKAASADEAAVVSLLEQLLPPTESERQGVADSDRLRGREDDEPIDFRCGVNILARYAYWPPRLIDQMKEKEVEVCDNENQSLAPGVS